MSNHLPASFLPLTSYFQLPASNINTHLFYPLVHQPAMGLAAFTLIDFDKMHAPDHQHELFLTVIPQVKTRLLIQDQVAEVSKECPVFIIFQAICGEISKTRNQYYL